MSVFQKILFLLGFNRTLPWKDLFSSGNNLQKLLAQGEPNLQTYFAGHVRFDKFSNDDNQYTINNLFRAMGSKLELETLVIYPRHPIGQVRLFLESMINTVFNVQHIVFNGFQCGLFKELEYKIETTAKEVSFYERSENRERFF